MTQAFSTRAYFTALDPDLTHEAPDAPLPEAVRDGTQPYMVVGAIAGG